MIYTIQIILVIAIHILAFMAGWYFAKYLNDRKNRNSRQ